MEFIAIRENMGFDSLKSRITHHASRDGLSHQHAGNDWGASSEDHRSRIRP
jgi:hypothetical protein